ncbi:hypothetical protein DL93DRAFT_2051255 [Clavulina sp. PMI_390]|nr:hypothetical protein DL93DRAFT_2051255 [Clavulina sp. PMI_390]
MVAISTNTLDHIVHRVEDGKLAEGVAWFKERGFNVLPGGTHSDNMTYNSLVVLADGVYLEIIAFLHPVEYYPPGSPERARREAHWWGKIPLGWIDWAHLDPSPPPSQIYRQINQRVGGKILYGPPGPGGRTREDGIVLKWTITARKQPPGYLPFYCQDLTPRKLRVPEDPPSNTVHPNTAKGIHSLTLFAHEVNWSERIENLSATLGTQPILSSPTRVVWEVATGHAGITEKPPVLELILREEAGSEEAGKVGLVKVTFQAEGGQEITI